MYRLPQCLSGFEGKVNVKVKGVVKSRRMRWAGHVARMGEGRGVHRVLIIIIFI